MATRPTIDFEGAGLFDIEGELVDETLRQATLRCIEIQKACADLGRFQPDPGALGNVSEEALENVLAGRNDVHGIASDRSISNVIVFSASNIEHSVRDPGVEQARRQVDAEVMKLVRCLFGQRSGLEVFSSGHLWYPPGSWMGWHTNSRVQGWRVYVNFAEEEGKSFFRYRDPRDGRVVTLSDRNWNIRVFRIRADEPLWHAVYSDTNRFSMGYIVRRVDVSTRIGRRLKRLFGAAPAMSD
jgi:hypothetical protein